MGRRQGESFSDPRTRLGCKLWLERVLGYYGEKGGVDIEIIDGQLGICAGTVGFLYDGFTPLRTRYVPGSRPVLERIVADTLSKGMSDRKKVLALMRRCRDARDHGIKARRRHVQRDLARLHLPLPGGGVAGTRLLGPHFGPHDGRSLRGRAMDLDRSVLRAGAGFG
jgi:hypothetical protein